MKKFIILFLSVVCILGLVGCNSELPDPNTNLEFWILDNVEDVDFSKYQERYGSMGSMQYYGMGYVPLKDEYDSQKDPKCRVVYTVTPYPDYSSENSYITGILITDPKIEFYGISMNTSIEDRRSILKELGFTHESSSDASDDVVFIQEAKDIFVKGKVSISFSSKEIEIRAAVTNKLGLLF